MTLDSFKINLDTGRWSDFATGDRGWQCKRRSGRGFAGPRPALELRLGVILGYAFPRSALTNSVVGLAAGLGGNDPMLRKANGAAWEPSHQARPMREACARARIQPPDENEITAALALLKDLPLEGAIVTGDASFCR